MSSLHFTPLPFSPIPIVGDKRIIGALPGLLAAVVLEQLSTVGLQRRGVNQLNNTCTALIDGKSGLLKSKVISTSVANGGLDPAITMKRLATCEASRRLNIRRCSPRVHREGVQPRIFRRDCFGIPVLNEFGGGVCSILHWDVVTGNG